MARKKQQKDVITRLAETGEEALHRLAELPGGARFADAANALRDRVDELAKRMRSLDPLERRVAELERRLDALSKPARRKTTTTRKPS
jgi:ubiquinone biosynthesis protein UbiJ